MINIFQERWISPLIVPLMWFLLLLFQLISLFNYFDIFYRLNVSDVMIWENISFSIFVFNQGLQQKMYHSVFVFQFAMQKINLFLYLVK